MAKKKAEKSLDELLEEALVKKGEEPYEVPGNWEWVRIGDNFELRNEKLVPQNGDNLPYIGLEHMAKGGGILSVSNTEGIKSSKSIFKRNDVLYGKLRPYLDKHSQVDFNGVCSTDILVFRNKKHYIPVLLNLYLGLPHIVRSSVESSSGINLPRVSGKIVSKFPMPLPPLPEQKRIVKKLSAILGKLKEARELIQEAKDTFEERRAAILNKAFIGELTKKWRDENPDVGSAEKSFKKLLLKNNNNLSIVHSEIINRLPGTWENVPSMHLFSFVTSGSRGWAKYYSDKGAIFIRITNLDYNSIELNIDPQKTKFVNLPDKVEGKRSRLQKDDILISITGDVGMIAIIPTKFPEAYINQHIALARPIKGLVVKYIGLFLASRFDGLAQLKRKQKGATKAGLGLNDIKTIEVPFPPIEEQKEIVRILENLLHHENEAKALIDMEEQIDLIEKSVLSKAFRGKLSTNDPNDEPAIELLKKSLKEKTNK